MPQITLKGHIIVSDADLAVVMEALPAHIELTRKEEGCLKFEVTQDPDNRKAFNVYEVFVDRRAFEAHQRRVQASTWGSVTVDVKRHYQITEAD